MHQPTEAALADDDPHGPIGIYERPHRPSARWLWALVAVLAVLAAVFWLL